VLHGVALVQI